MVQTSTNGDTGEAVLRRREDQSKCRSPDLVKPQKTADLRAPTSSPARHSAPPKQGPATTRRAKPVAVGTASNDKPQPSSQPQPRKSRPPKSGTPSDALSDATPSLTEDTTEYDGEDDDSDVEIIHRDLRRSPFPRPHNTPPPREVPIQRRTPTDLASHEASLSSINAGARGQSGGAPLDNIDQPSNNRSLLGDSRDREDTPSTTSSSGRRRRRLIPDQLFSTPDFQLPGQPINYLPAATSRLPLDDAPDRMTTKTALPESGAEVAIEGDDDMEEEGAQHGNAGALAPTRGGARHGELISPGPAADAGISPKKPAKSSKAALRVQLKMNLEIEVELKAAIHGDVTLQLF